MCVNLWIQDTDTQQAMVVWTGAGSPTSIGVCRWDGAGHIVLARATAFVAGTAIASDEIGANGLTLPCLGNPLAIMALNASGHMIGTVAFLDRGDITY